MPESGPTPFPPEFEAELAALADGRLDPERATVLLARAEREPELARAIEAQRTAVSIVSGAAAQVMASHDLRLRIDALGQRPARRRARRRWWPAAIAAAAAAAFLVAIVLPSGDLEVRDALTAMARPPVAAVGVDPQVPALLRERVEDVPFPNYAAKFGWKAVGTRVDELDGRRARTVFYERAGRRVAYTIIPGAPLPEPADTEVVVRDGVPLRVFREGDRTVVTWRRLGRTCVMSAVGVPSTTLVELAAWKAKGAVDF